jgi:hypothetical protein
VQREWLGGGGRQRTTAQEAAAPSSEPQRRLHALDYPSVPFGHDQLGRGSFRFRSSPELAC